MIIYKGSLGNLTTTFEQRLASAVARANSAEAVIVTSGAGRIVEIVGEEEDVERAVYTYDFLHHELALAARVDWVEGAKDARYENLTSGRHWTAFWTGATVLIDKRIPSRPAKVRASDIDEYAEPVPRIIRNVAVDQDAFLAGARAAIAITRLTRER